MVNLIPTTVLTLTVFVAAISSVFASELCPVENCIVPDHCEQLMKGDILCSEQGTKCCSVVKSEFRTHCRHHGGICMENCATDLKRQTVDCPSEVCCVLV